MRTMGTVSSPLPVSRDLLRFGPHAGAHRVALRAGTSVLVPLLVLWTFDRLDWAIYAAFGAFASLYGRNHVHLSRAQMQLSLAVLLTTAVGLGVWVGTSPARGWLAVPVATVVAGVGAWLSDAEDWHPPGPLFLIFAFAACASVPSVAGDIPVALLVAGSSALFAMIVGSCGALWRAWRHPQASVRTSWQRPVWRPSTTRHVVRAIVGVLVSGAIATSIGIGHPYWAMVSAVVPLAARELRPQLVRGVHRVVGTMLGLLLAGLLLGLDPDGLVLILVVVALQVAAELLVGRNYAVALVAITPLALLMVHLVAPTPTKVLLFDRGVETVIGVVIGLLVGYLTRDRTASR